MPWKHAQGSCVPIEKPKRTLVLVPMCGWIARHQWQSYYQVDHGPKFFPNVPFIPFLPLSTPSLFFLLHQPWSGMPAVVSHATSPIFFHCLLHSSFSFTSTFIINHKSKSNGWIAWPRAWSWPRRWWPSATLLNRPRFALHHFHNNPLKPFLSAAIENWNRDFKQRPFLYLIFFRHLTPRKH